MLITVIQIALHFGRHEKFVSDPKFYLDMSRIFLNEMTLNEFFKKYGTYGRRAYLNFFKRPLIPALAALLYYFFRIPLEIGFAIINSCFYFSSVILFYYFIKKLGYRKNIAFTSSLLYSCSFTLLAVGASCLTDVGAYFFSILILFYTTDPIKEHWNSNNDGFLGEKFSIKKYLLLSILTGIGMLIRETVFFTTLAIFIYILMQDLKYYKKGWLYSEMKNLIFMILVLGSALIPIILWITYGMNISILDFSSIKINLLMLFRLEVILDAVFIILVAFNLNYIFLIVGYINEEDKNRRKFMIIYSMIMIIPMILQYFIMEPGAIHAQYRIFFMFFPFFLPLSALGLHEISKKLESKGNRKNFNRYFWYCFLMGLYILVNFMMGIFYMSQFILDALPIEF